MRKNCGTRWRGAGIIYFHYARELVDFVFGLQVSRRLRSIIIIRYCILAVIWPGVEGCGGCFFYGTGKMSG